MCRLTGRHGRALSPARPREEAQPKDRTYVWQPELVERNPELLLRGLIHSDGHRFINTGRGDWSCPRYGFRQVSDDIRGIFGHACDLMGLRRTRSGRHTVYVSRKADVALLDTFIGPKR